MNKFIIGVIVGVAILLAGYGLTNAPVPKTFGGAEHPDFQQFFGGMSVGQGVFASSTSASVTLSGSEFVNTDKLDYTVNIANQTLTLPASTTPLCTSLPPNQRRDIFIRHASTTAANTLTIAGSASIPLKLASSTTVAAVAATVIGTTDGSGYAKITLVKRNAVAAVGCDALLTTFN